MTANEIKNAWNTFKKEAKKEISFDLTGRCYMNAKQIESHTATIALCNDIEYDNEIACCVRSIERVNAYTSWTDEEKKNSEERNRESIEQYESLKAAYGTRANEAEVKYTTITESKAYKKMAKAIGIKNADLELVHKWEGLNLYQIRINY